MGLMGRPIRILWTRISNSSKLPGLFNSTKIRAKIYARYQLASVVDNEADEMSSSSIPSRLNPFSKSLSIGAWNSQIRNAVNQNDARKALLLYSEMKQNGPEPDNFTFPFVAKACARITDLKSAKAVHSHVVKSNFRSDVYVQTALVDTYSKCNRLDYAYNVFDGMPERDATSWNAMLVGFAQSGFVDRVLCLFRDMRLVGTEADSVTVMAMTRTALHMNSSRFLKAVHSLGVRIGTDSDVSVANTWVSAYAKSSDFDSAKSVFQGIDLRFRTVVSWNSIIGACAEYNSFAKAFDYFKLMLREEHRPDLSTFVSLAASCSQPEALSLGRLIHSQAILSGCDQDVAVANTLISMYSNCGDIESARALFNSMSARTCVSWTVIISGYAEIGNIGEARTLFLAMQETGENPDLVTLLTLISGCGRTGSLEIGKWIDDYAFKNRFKGNNVTICNAFIDMYSKCGSITNAREIFNGVSDKSVVTWTAMISGYAMNGAFVESLDLFDEMRNYGHEPNHITFLAVLQACAHSGFLDKGLKYFSMMKQHYKISPGLDHYSCIVDLLGKKGELTKALELIQTMPVKPDAGIWGALLGACKTHRDVETGKYVVNRLIELEPRVAAPYVEMANMYACAGMWDGVARIRSMMKCNKVRKYPGESGVEVNGKNHVFRVEDREHVEELQIYSVLDGLSLLARDAFGDFSELEGIFEYDS